MKWWILMPCLALKLTGLWVLFHSQALGLVLFFSGGAIVLAQIFLPRSQGLCGTYFRFRPQGREIWLTIDDGPCPEDTPKILELLRQHDAKATFFLIGQRAVKYPELVDAILAEGHQIGCHTHTHPAATFWAAGPVRVSRELDQSLSKLNRAGHAVELFRAPVGIKSLFLASALRRRGMRSVAWAIRSGDGTGSNPEQILSRVRQKLKPGAILLMHEGPDMAPAVRVEAIRRVLELLDQADYRAIVPSADRFLRKWR